MARYRVTYTGYNWKVQPRKGKDYNISKDNYLVMYNCLLRNEKKKSKTFGIKNKSIFGVIECEDLLSISYPATSLLHSQIYYSTKSKPFWHDSIINLDNTEIAALTTVGDRIYKF